MIRFAKTSCTTKGSKERRRTHIHSLKAKSLRWKKFLIISISIIPNCKTRPPKKDQNII